MTIQIMQLAFIVSIVVGTMLNLINQGRDILRGNEIKIFKGIFNYSVPFVVSLVSMNISCPS